MGLLDRIANLLDPGPGPPPPHPKEWDTRPSLDIERWSTGGRIIPVEGDELVFDATISEQHSEVVDITTHPVELGLSVTDHAIVQPVEVQLINVLTLTPLTADLAVPRRHFDLYERLRALMFERQPVALVTRLRAYESMMIVEVSTPVTSDDGESLVPSVRLREIRIVEGQVAKVPAEYLAPEVSSSAAAEVDEGSQPADDAEEEEEDAGGSILAGIDDETGGRLTDVLGAGLEAAGFNPVAVP